LDYYKSLVYLFLSLHINARLSRAWRPSRALVHVQYQGTAPYLPQSALYFGHYAEYVLRNPIVVIIRLSPSYSSPFPLKEARLRAQSAIKQFALLFLNTVCTKDHFTVSEPL
jgi:hypothetical protein